MKKNENCTIIPDSLYVIKIRNYDSDDIELCGLATNYKTAEAIVRDFHPLDDWWNEWEWTYEIEEVPYTQAFKYLLGVTRRLDMILHWDIRVYPYCKRKWRNELYVY